MSEDKFLSDLTDIMDTEVTLSMNTVLKDLEEWDSLSQLTFVSYLVRFAKNKSVDATEIRHANTVRDLYNFVCA